MKIQTVSAMVGVRAKREDDFFALKVYRHGPDAIPVTEIPILMSQNGQDSITDVAVVGEYETTKADEHDRLARKFRKAIINPVYPSEAIPLPTSVEHLGLEPWQFAGGAENNIAERRRKALAELKALEALEQQPQPQPQPEQKAKGKAA